MSPTQKERLGKMEIQCPYTALDMRIAMINLDESNFTEEKLNKFQNQVLLSLGNIDNKADMNKKIAEANGINVETLINSPNYKLLVQEFIAKGVKTIVALSREELGLNDKQAWGVLMSILSPEEMENPI